MLPAKRCAVREGQESPGVYDATLPTGRARQGGIFLPRVARNFSARRVPLVDRVNWATREASGQYSVRNGQTFGWGATMGSMSASDAAPLPRLGEVFFDVRGSSRSMRLSWYADTGISVFSIWQGGTCTGTFRLPQEELPRLIDALQRGMYPDPRGTGGFPRQLPGAPTDPRLTAVPGYGGVREIGREAGFTRPVPGVSPPPPPEAPAGTAALGIPAVPRALPPGGGYSDQ